MSLDPTMQRTDDVQRQERVQAALARVLRLATLLATAPRREIPLEITAGLDALKDALDIYEALRGERMRDA